MITGTVRIGLQKPYDETSLAEVTARSDRRRLDVLERCPDGAHVVVDVGSRGWLYDDALALLRRHGDRLQIEVVATEPEIVFEIVQAARRGSLGVVA